MLEEQRIGFFLLKTKILSIMYGNEIFVMFLAGKNVFPVLFF